MFCVLCFSWRMGQSLSRTRPARSLFFVFPGSYPNRPSFESTAGPVPGIPRATEYIHLLSAFVLYSSRRFPVQVWEVIVACRGLQSQISLLRLSLAESISKGKSIGWKRMNELGRHYGENCRRIKSGFCRSCTGSASTETVTVPLRDAGKSEGIPI